MSRAALKTTALLCLWKSMFCILLSMHEHVLSRFSCVRLFVIPWIVAHKILLSMGFSKARIDSKAVTVRTEDSNLFQPL